MSIHNSFYPCGGEQFRGYLNCGPRVEGRARPGVLVLHEGSGLIAETARWADMLSEAGYAAFAPDMFGREFQSRTDGMAVVVELAQHPTLLVERLRDALQFLASQENVDRSNLLVVGFCFGGFAALELVRSGADLRAVACVHGGLVAKREVAPGSIKASILACVGADDPFITPEQRGAFEREMTAAQADWQLFVYSQTMHAFTNPKADPSVMAGCAYNALSDRRAWANVLGFFGEAIST